jgi:hypothetical protein
MGRRREPLRLGRDLYVVIWSPAQKLLFIHSSANAGGYAPLAKAVAGEDATLISGQDVFRVFAGVNRLRYQNIGLSEQLGRNVRYTGRMGGVWSPRLRISCGDVGVNQSCPARDLRTVNSSVSGRLEKEESGRTRAAGSTNLPRGPGGWR